MSAPNDANTYLPGVIQIPSTLEITAITQTFPMAITVAVDPVTASNTYIVRQLVKLFIPHPYGMQQANGLTGSVLTNVGSVITLDIDATLFDPFVTPPPFTSQPASLSPSGSRNLEFSNFTNQVPFQSLNNRGN